MGHREHPKNTYLVSVPCTKTQQAFSPLPTPPHPHGSPPSACAPAPRALWEQDTPTGCSSARPRARILLQPRGDAGSGAGAATAGNAGGGRSLLRLGLPDRGEVGEGEERKALPLPGEFSGWGPSERAGGPSLGTGASGITAGMPRRGVR